MNDKWPLTVLVIEDDPEVLDIIQAHLSGPGRQVLSRQRMRAAGNWQVPSPVDLITLDLYMSPVDCRDVSQRLRADVATCLIPVVLVWSSTRWPTAYAPRGS